MADGPPTAELALRIDGLTKSYRIGFLHRHRRCALRGITLQVPRNEVFGYLGPNGSGKTTTLKVLMGLLSADAGSISVLGCPHQDRSWRYRVGFLAEHPYFYDYLTARESLDYMGRLFGLEPRIRRERSRALLEKVGLLEWADTALRRYSKGMVQRFGIAQALLNEPELLFLDEPMSGLDPLGRHLVRDLIRDLRSQGKTVLFSTHILQDAETLCDSVAVLRGGELVRAGRLSEILTLDVKHIEVLISCLDESAFGGFPAGVSSRVPIGDRWRLEVDEPALGAVIAAAQARGARVLSVSPVRQSLEEYFVREFGSQAGRGAWVAEA
jgi:ABC-2 type transport system ATP-binding protein